MVLLKLGKYEIIWEQFSVINRKKKKQEPDFVHAATVQLHCLE